MSCSQSGNITHDKTVAVAESTRQAAVAGATQAAARTADIAFYRAALASAKANTIATSQFVTALTELGTGGA